MLGRDPFGGGAGRMLSGCEAAGVVLAPDPQDASKGVAATLLAAMARNRRRDGPGRLVVGNTGSGQSGHSVFALDHRVHTGLEASERLNDALSLRRVSPDADSLVSGWLPGRFVDDDRVPADLPF